MSRHLLAADGKIKLTGAAEKLSRWQEHFCEVCNIPSAVTEQTLETISEAQQSSVTQADNEALSVVPSKEEIREAISQLKSGKADMIVAELLKLGG